MTIWQYFKVFVLVLILINKFDYESQTVFIHPKN